MRIDAHQHFWKYNPEEFAWIDDKMKDLCRDFMPSDLSPDLSVAKLNGSIAVQARQTIEETFFLLELANKYDFIKGVVGWVDLRSKDLRDQLNVLAKNTKLIGLRHVIQDEPFDDFILQPNFIKGISRLKEFDLAYDILIFERHLPNVVKFLKHFPDQHFILDHIAKPNMKEGLSDRWKKGIKDVSAFDNVYCKLSGMVTEADWSQGKKTDFTPFLDHVVDCFGIEKVMMGSDWPVCTVARNYQKTMEIITKYFSSFSESEKSRVFGINAIEAYRIEI